MRKTYRECFVEAAPIVVILAAGSLAYAWFGHGFGDRAAEAFAGALFGWPLVAWVLWYFPAAFADRRAGRSR